MVVRKCSVPKTSGLESWKGTVSYADAFEVPLSQSELSIHEIYYAIFSRPPVWLKNLLIIRHKVVSIFGLKGPSWEQLNSTEAFGKYAVGDKICLWEIYYQDENELLTGVDDKHLDFRVSVSRRNERGTEYITLTTVVKCHNVFGKVYLGIILPFHKRGIRALLGNAASANRI